MKKKFLAMFLCAAMALSMTACGGDEKTVSGNNSETAGDAQDDTYHFEVIVKSFQSTYWQAAVKGVDQACKELGVEANCNGPANESDIADQIQMFEAAIAKNPDGIALAACDTNSVLSSLQKALDAGIPVVCFDTGIEDAPEGSVAATVATDNEAAGACAAENMYPVIKKVLAAATTDEKVRIGEVNQDATALNIQQRGLGFVNKMIELCEADGIKVAVEGNEFYVNEVQGAAALADASVVIEIAVPAQTTVELSAAEAQKIMAKEDTVAIFGSNQTTIEGVITANGTLNKLGTDPETSIIAAGFDAGTPQKEAIMAGQLIGSVTQSPLMMGYTCIETLNAVCNGETVEDVPMDGYWYDAATMENEDIKPNLYD